MLPNPNNLTWELAPTYTLTFKRALSPSAWKCRFLKRDKTRESDSLNRFEPLTYFPFARWVDFVGRRGADHGIGVHRHVSSREGL